jgi:hypothetical protein
MPLDLPTLFLVSTCVTALLGIDRRICGRAVGREPGHPAGGQSGDLASALLFTCCGLIWSGARIPLDEASVGGAIAGANRVAGRDPHAGTDAMG